jgi:hypothetical protein
VPTAEILLQPSLQGGKQSKGKAGKAGKVGKVGKVAVTSKKAKATSQKRPAKKNS